MAKKVKKTAVKQVAKQHKMPGGMMMSDSEMMNQPKRKK